MQQKVFRTGLPFVVLREANIRRLPLFKNKHGEPAHRFADGSDWSLDQWLQAVDGETGEYANVRKKRDRGDITQEEFQQLAAAELADAVTYIDILAFRARIDLGAAVAIVCKETDERSRTPVLVDSAIADSRELSQMTFGQLFYSMAPIYPILGCDTEGFQAAQMYNRAKHELAKAGALITEHPGAAGRHLAAAVVFLYCLGMAQEIDVGQAIVDKWNHVSVRVRCGLSIQSLDGHYFVHTDGSGDNPAPTTGAI